MRFSASLPMYVQPVEVEQANRTLLDKLFERLGVARAVVADSDLDSAWLADDLLLSQTCGYPLVERLGERVRLIGRPDYRVAMDAEAVPGTHRSLIVVAADDPRCSLEEFRGADVAINGLASNTGMNLLRRRVAPLAREGRFFTRRLISGSHRASMALVAERRAGLAAIDTVTWDYHLRYAPALLEGLRVLDVTPWAPTLPLIGAGTLTLDEAECVRVTLERILADYPALAEVLGFDTLLPTTLEDYRVLTSYRCEAERLGYAELC